MNIDADIVAERTSSTGPVPEPTCQHLLRFERLLSGVSSTLIAASYAEIPGRIEQALRAMVEFFGVDRAGLAERSPDGRDGFFRVTYGRPGAPLPVEVDASWADATPWYIGELLQGRVVCAGRLSDLPPEACRDREFAQQKGVKANLAVPVLMQAKWRYVVSLTSFTSEVDWPDDLVPRLRILAEMLASAYEHSQRERERERLYVAAQEAVRRRDEFISVASHELRTPCAALQLAVQALSRERPGELRVESDAVRRFLGTIGRQVANLSVLVERLLDVSLLAAGPLPIARTEVDLADVVRSVVERVQEPLRVSGSTLTVDAPEPVLGSWDRARLEQVAASLVSNAIKFGMGAPIEVVVRAQGSAATLVVRDHGIGISPADQGRVFGRFERAVSTENFGGFGLGLYIAKSIVDAHRGSLAVTSRPGEGSTFVVSLPRA
jgi:signal transduction histidine kinase